MDVLGAQERWEMRNLFRRCIGVVLRVWIGGEGRLEDGKIGWGSMWVRGGLEWARRECMDRERWRCVCRGHPLDGRFWREQGIGAIDWLNCRLFVDKIRLWKNLSYLINILSISWRLLPMPWLRTADNDLWGRPSAILGHSTIRGWPWHMCPALSLSMCHKWDYKR